MADQEIRLYEFDAYQLDTRQRLLRHNDRPVTMEPKTFDVLLMLVRNHGRLLTKDQLLDEVWPDTKVGVAGLANRIAALRKVFGEHPGENRFIGTRPGIGYWFAAPVTAQPVLPLSPEAVPIATAAGRWRAEVTYEHQFMTTPRFVTCSEIFEFEVDGDELFGSASFYRVPQALREGRVHKNNRLSFITTGTRAYGSAAQMKIVRRYSGKLLGDVIEFGLTVEGAYFAEVELKFTAYRM